MTKGIVTKAVTNIKSMTAGVGTVATLAIGGYVYGELTPTDIINFTHYYDPTGKKIELGQKCKITRSTLTLKEEAEPEVPVDPPPTDETPDLTTFDIIRQIREGVPTSAGVTWGNWKYEGVKYIEEPPL